MAREENDDASLRSIEKDAHAVEKTVEDVEFRRMFSNPMDPNNCFLDIQAGSGGTEAQDWAAMLERMYLRYCERKGYRTEVLEAVLFQPGIRKGIGVDAGVGVQYRPRLNDNIVFTGGVGALFPQDGFKNIYNGRTLYSGFVNARVVY